MPVIVLALLLVYAPSAQAYIGPGLGLELIGSFLSVVLTVLTSLVALVWYPIKRLREKLWPRGNAPADEAEDDPS